MKFASDLLLHRKVKNRLNEAGEITACEDEKVVVTYQSGKEQTLYFAIAYEKGYLEFLDEEDRTEIHSLYEEALTEERKHQAEIEARHQQIAAERKLAQEELLKLEYTAKKMQRLFGNDFIYPPYLAFLNSHPYLIQTVRFHPTLAEKREFRRKNSSQPIPSKPKRGRAR